MRPDHGSFDKLDKPDLSILSEEFLAEVRGMPQRNLAVELLQKLLKGEIRVRRKRNVVQARSFAELLEQERATHTVLEQAEVLSEAWAGRGGRYRSTQSARSESMQSSYSLASPSAASGR